MPHTLRPFQADDLAKLYAINCASEPGVGAVSERALGDIIAQGDCFVAIQGDGAPAGFLLTLGSGKRYASKNYHWFEDRYEDYVYIDRIAVAPNARNLGLGAKLYQHGFKHYTGKTLLMGCEVNTVPANPGSMQFHTRLGFSEIGTQIFNDGYAVAYLARRLTP